MKLLKNPGSQFKSETKATKSEGETMTKEEAEELAKKAQSVWKTITGTPSTGNGNTYKSLFDLTPNQTKEKYSAMFNASTQNSTGISGIPTWNEIVKNRFSNYSNQ